MRVTLQLVLCSDDGQEETITDSVTLQKDGMNQTNRRQVSETHGMCDNNVTSTFFDVIWTTNLSLFSTIWPYNNGRFAATPRPCVSGAGRSSLGPRV